jgi:long-subunit acyl-CoA synthetase (AMP-forming)
MVVLAEDLRGSLNDSAVRTRVENEMEQLLKRVNAAIASYEQLQMLVISQEAWSIENGFLTPTMKIKRSRIEAAAEDKIGNWYQSGKTVIWS